MPSSIYTAWMYAVVVELDALADLGPDDLPDIDYVALHAAGCSPAEAAEQALANADAPDLLFFFILDLGPIQADEVPW